MRDDNQVGGLALQPVQRRPGAAGKVVPAFSAGGTDVARGFPEGADQGRVFGLDLGEA